MAHHGSYGIFLHYYHYYPFNEHHLIYWYPQPLYLCSSNFECSCGDRF